MSFCDIVPNFLESHGLKKTCEVCRPGDDKFLLDEKFGQWACKHHAGLFAPDYAYTYETIRTEDCPAQPRCSWLYIMLGFAGIFALSYKYGKRA